MASEIDDLKKRVEQLEKALLAVATGRPTCLDKDGRIMPADDLMPVYGSTPVEE